MSPVLTLLVGALIVFLAVCCICATIQAAQTRTRNSNNPNFYKEKLKEKTLKTVQAKRRQTARDIMLLREELKQAETRLLEESKYEQELQESYRKRSIEETNAKKQQGDARLRNRRRFGDSPNFSDADDIDFKEPLKMDIGKEEVPRVRNPYKHDVERSEDIFTLIWKKLKNFHSPAKEHKSDEEYRNLNQDFPLEEGDHEERIEVVDKPATLDFLKINMLDIKKSRSKYVTDDFREETPPTPTRHLIPMESVRHTDQRSMESRHSDPRSLESIQYSVRNMAGEDMSLLKIPSHDEASKQDLYFTPRKGIGIKSTASTSLDKTPRSIFSPILTPLSYLKDKLNSVEKTSYEFARVAPDETKDKKFGVVDGEMPASISIEIGDSPIQVKTEEKIAQKRKFKPAERPLSRAPTSLKPLKKISPKYHKDSDQSPLRPRRRNSQRSSETRKHSYANLPILDSPPGTPRQKKPKLAEVHPLHSSNEEPKATSRSLRSTKAHTPRKEIAKASKEEDFLKMDSLGFVTPPARTRKLLGKAEDPSCKSTSSKLKVKPLTLKPIKTRRGDIKKQVPALSAQKLRSQRPPKGPKLLQSQPMPKSPKGDFVSLKPEPPVEVIIKSPEELGIKPIERLDPSSLKIESSPKQFNMNRKLSKKRLSGVKSPTSLLSRPGSSRRAQIKTPSRPGSSRKKIGLENEEVDLLIEDRPSSPLVPDASTLKIDRLISAATPSHPKSKSKKVRQRKLRGLIEDDSPKEVKPKRRKIEVNPFDESDRQQPQKNRLKSASRRDKEKRRPKLSRMTARRKKKSK